MLHVVQHEQQFPVGQLGAEQLEPPGRIDFAKTECAADGGEQLLEVDKRGQVNEDGSVDEPVADGRGELDREARLADAARPRERDEPGTGVEEASRDLGELSIATDRVGMRKWHAKPPRGFLHRGGEGGILSENAPLELTELGAGVEAELRHEQLPSLPIGCERIRLAAAPIERNHQLAAQSLPKRMVGHEPLQVRRELNVTAQAKLDVDAVLHAREPQLVQTRRLVANEQHAVEIGERFAAPQLERRGEVAGCATELTLGRRAPPVGHEPLEPVGVELVVVDRKPVAGLLCQKPALGKCPPELRDVDMQDAARRDRRRAVPYRFDEGVGARAPATPEHEGCEQRPGPAAEPDRLTVDKGLERAEYAKFEAPFLPQDPIFPSSPTDGRCSSGATSVVPGAAVPCSATPSSARLELTRLC